MFRIDVVIATPITAKTSHSSGETDDCDTILRLFDAAGNELAFNDDISLSDLNSRLAYTPAQSGECRIVVTSYLPGATGHFVLAIQEKK